MNGRQLTPRQVVRLVRAARRWGGTVPTSTRGLRTGILAGILSGLLLSGLLIWTSSEAAFTSSTANSSSWSAGTVHLTDDSSSALFTPPAGILPGDTEQKCIEVTYGGNITAGVKVYVSSLTGDLGPYLNMTIEQGTGGSSSSCTGFVAQTSVSTTVSALGTNWAAGFGNWAPTGAGQVRTYRFTWSLARDNAAVNRTAGVTFTWQAQST